MSGAGGHLDYDSTLRVLAAFEAAGVTYAVFGGAALNFHGLARFTEDLDVFIEPTRDNIDRLRTALKAVYHDPHLDQITAEDLLGDYPAVQYVPPTGAFHIDLLTRLGEAFRFEDLDIQRLPCGELTISVASPRTLYRMKKDTVRLKDRADAELLRARFHLGEES